MAVLLSSKAVGSVVRLNVNGVATDFIVVQQGNPDSSVYDASCDGVWLLSRYALSSSRKWDSTNNDYENSDIHAYLNGDYFNQFDSFIQSAIKQVKIPYTKGTGKDGSVKTGSNGLSTKIFLLARSELTTTTTSYYNHEGAVLDYFEGITGTLSNKYICYSNSTARRWWLRNPSTTSTSDNYIDSVAVANTNGDINGSWEVDNYYYVRPAMVLPGTLYVDDSGNVTDNAPPTITSTSGASGVNLGTKSAGFNISYTVADADGDTLTVTEKLDGVTKRTFTTTGGTYTFEAVNADNFRKVLNGTHTLSVLVSDGTESVTFTATFTKSVTSASITLAAPLTVEGDITLAVAAVTGSIPADAEYTFEVTNNANDTTPVWQDVTAEVKNGGNIVFENTACANGAAFNFRLKVKRGASGAGGYIEGIAGAFQ